MRLYLLLLVGFFVHVADSYNILFMLPFGSRSHKNVFDPVAEELAKRGHKVDMFSSFEEKKEPPGVRSVAGKILKTMFEQRNISGFSDPLKGPSSLAKKFNMINSIAEIAFEDPFITDIIKEPLDPLTKRPKYDVVVIDAVFNDYSMAIGHHLGVPNIIFSPTTALIHHSWNLNIPYPLSYIPSAINDVPEPMGFLDRARSAFSNLMFLYFSNCWFISGADGVIKKYFPNAPPLIELNRNVSFMLSNSLPALHLRKPSMPYTAEVGGLNCKPAKPLPEDLETFMKQSGKFGVIYFSLGAFTKGEAMPLEMRDKLIEEFGKLPQKILWKYEQDIPNLPVNIKLVKWAPQQDILAHSKTRLFITHGGGLSLLEAAYHGCPILAFPLTADQLGNVVQARRNGFGDYLNWKTFTGEEFIGAIKKLLDDKSYKEKALLASVLLKDRPQNPVETAAYWIEYVVRHNGAPFLKPSADHLNFFQYFLLDIIAAAIAVLVVLLIVLYYIAKFSCKLLCAICRSVGLCKKSVPISKKTKNKKKTN